MEKREEERNENVDHQVTTEVARVTACDGDMEEGIRRDFRTFFPEYVKNVMDFVMRELDRLDKVTKENAQLRADLQASLERIRQLERELSETKKANADMTNRMTTKRTAQAEQVPPAKFPRAAKGHHLEELEEQEKFLEEDENDKSFATTSEL